MSSLPEYSLAQIGLDPVALLQRLLRFDTTNPPGDEAACIGFIGEILASAGLESTIVARAPERPNLLARLPGRGVAPPLLLYGHVDVVPTTNQQWTYPPFAGVLADGYVWGRGALDMKGGVAMLLSAFLRAKAAPTPPPGDVLIGLLSDEERGGVYGARALVEEHSECFEGVRYAIGEFGGFSFTAGGRRFYPIMVAEKQICTLRATVRGPGGHGSLPLRGGAMARLGEVLRRLDRGRLPVHITPVARLMIGQMVAALPAPLGPVLAQLLNPALTDRMLDLLGEQARVFGPVLHNTVSPTIVRGGEAFNVIPSVITLDLDGRLLPGFDAEQLCAEVGRLLGDAVELEVLNFESGPPEPDMARFGILADTLRELDAEGLPIPLLLAGVTDGRHFARLGIQTYGFLPMRLPPGFDFSATIHAADERIPVGALAFGAEAIYRVIQRMR